MEEKFAYNWKMFGPYIGALNVVLLLTLVPSIEYVGLQFVVLILAGLNGFMYAMWKFVWSPFTLDEEGLRILVGKSVQRSVPYSAIKDVYKYLDKPERHVLLNRQPYFFKQQAVVIELADEQFIVRPEKTDNFISLLLQNKQTTIQPVSKPTMLRMRQGPMLFLFAILFPVFFFIRSGQLHWGYVVPLLVVLSAVSIYMRKRKFMVETSRQKVVGLTITAVLIILLIGGYFIYSISQISTDVEDYRGQISPRVQYYWNIMENEMPETILFVPDVNYHEGDQWVFYMRNNLDASVEYEVFLEHVSGTSYGIRYYDGLTMAPSSLNYWEYEIYAIDPEPASNYRLTIKDGVEVIATDDFVIYAD
jgi:hypothetical protein